MYYISSFYVAKCRKIRSDLIEPDLAGFSFKVGPVWSVNVVQKVDLWIGACTSDNARSTHICRLRAERGWSSRASKFPKNKIKTGQLITPLNTQAQKYRISKQLLLATILQKYIQPRWSIPRHARSTHANCQREPLSHNRLLSAQYEAL
jgi:hypothetical protein